MKMSFSFLHLTDAPFSYQCSTYQYWIIMNGGGTLISENETPYSFLPHDTFAFPEQSCFEVHFNQLVEVGCVQLTDFEATNRTIVFLPRQHTELIRKTFLFAYDLQGAHYLNNESMMNSITQLMFQALMCLEPDVLSINPFVENIIRNITANYLNPDYDIAKDIAVTGYSTSHFRKLFREQTGTSPYHFLMLHRLEHACKLIYQDSSLSIKEIAARSGFSDALYFSKLFKKYKGVSPSHYQKDIFDENK